MGIVIVPTIQFDDPLNQLHHRGVSSMADGKLPDVPRVSQKWEVYIACIPRIHLMIIYDQIPNKAITVLYHIPLLKYIT